jgi:cyclophilin family peptidyl-prolyl cis-trans isomerase
MKLHSGKARRQSKSFRTGRLARVEMLEPRCVLAAPTLGVLPTDVVVAAGAPLHIALDGYDADGDSLTYSVTSTNPDLAGSIPKQDNPNGNRSLRMSVAGFGEMEFELFEGRVPHVTQRIIELAATHWYDGRIFHRIIPNFMIQGGSRDGLGLNGTGVEFDDEFHPTLQHTSANLLSMAKAGDDTNDSQFFITDRSTRWLDFNHSIFGMLTAGEDVRQAIEAVPTDGNPPTGANRPLAGLEPVIQSVTVFQDTENAVMMLAAPDGASGEADVTITVSDGQGGTAQQTIHVTILPDSQVDASHNSPPYLEPIAPVFTNIDTPYSFTLDTVDIEGDPVYYSAQVNAGAAHMDIAVDGGGKVTVTPKNGQFGIFEVTLRAGPSPASFALDQYGRFQESLHDAQTIPVFVRPPAPSVALQPVSDTGDLDGITSINNAGKLNLRFMVSEVDSLATVKLLIDGVIQETTEIGRTSSSGGSFGDEVEVMVSTPLDDDAYVVTALQTFQLGAEYGYIAFDGEQSDPILVTIDTQPPEIITLPVKDAFVGQAYAYQVLAIDGPNNVLKFEIRDPKPDGMTIDADTGAITWTPQAGDAAVYSLTVAAVDGAGNEGPQTFDLTVHAAEPTWLGPVDFRENPHEAVDQEQWYKLETTHDAYLTVEALAADGSVAMALYSPDRETLVGQTSPGGEQRIDHPAQAGQVYFVQITGQDADFSLRLANLVDHEGTNVTVYGTGGDDTFAFDASASRRVTIGGVAYLFTDAEAKSVVFDGGEGRDLVVLDDSAGDEVLTAESTHAVFSNADPTTGFSVVVDGFEELQVYARSGGLDTAYLFGSDGNDKFKAEPDENYAKMYGSRQYNRVKFFDIVVADASQGGEDLARIFDSRGDDTLIATADESRFQNVDTHPFDVTAKAFDQVIAYSNVGGNDRVEAHDSAREDVFAAKRHKVEMYDRAKQGDQYKITARKFKYRQALADYPDGQEDVAKLFDTDADDVLKAEYLPGGATRATLSTVNDGQADELYEVIAFEIVKGYGTTGSNTRDMAPNVDFMQWWGQWEI